MHYSTTSNSTLQILNTENTPVTDTSIQLTFSGILSTKISLIRIVLVKVSFPASIGILRCSAEKLFLEISQNPQQNTCAKVSFFNKVAGLRLATLFKRRLWHMHIPENFAKFLRTPYFTEQLRWLR